MKLTNDQFEASAYIFEKANGNKKTEYEEVEKKYKKVASVGENFYSVKATPCGLGGRQTNCLSQREIPRRSHSLQSYRGYKVIGQYGVFHGVFSR